MLSVEEKEKIKYDLEKTLELIERNDPLYNMMTRLIGDSPFNHPKNYESLYTNATEDMRTYYKEFCTPTSFLSIGASGEQVINATSIGAKEIDVYDSNHLCIHGTNLRLAAVCALDKEELYRFYETFEPELFIRVLEQLDEAELNYWGNLYRLVGPEILRTRLFTYKRLDRSLVELINPYLDDSLYPTLKEKLAQVKINYLDCDLYSLPQHIQGKKYDAMTFSNIYEYLNYNGDIRKSKALDYRNFVMEAMYPHLNVGGAIMVSYMYAFNDSLKKDFDSMYSKNPQNLVGTGALTLEQANYYYAGLTTQNLAYSLLLDAMANDPIIHLETQHVQFGQSKDMSHDMALLLKNKL